MKPSGSVQDCNGIAVPLPLQEIARGFRKFHNVGFFERILLVKTRGQMDGSFELFD